MSFNVLSYYSWFLIWVLSMSLVALGYCRLSWLHCFKFVGRCSWKNSPPDHTCVLENRTRQHFVGLVLKIWQCIDYCSTEEADCTRFLIVLPLLSPPSEGEQVSAEGERVSGVGLFRLPWYRWQYRQSVLIDNLVIFHIISVNRRY